MEIKSGLLKTKNGSGERKEDENFSRFNNQETNGVHFFGDRDSDVCIGL